MLADISSVDAIYIVCGRTDMRKLKCYNKVVTEVANKI